eukprot:CAMPEP_0172310150 /NCGR_PEP_ID=MMETSP1058-20130122/11321_1 /TAXON_ID=83371 /ORGANISM="Detonula confervacea, Strain CCMP 353" /LENGTH=256 /DNA_ID=CAMNT_0013022917 /DNA_START=29 /DNA_END=799 /DNA_ORIENTATION=+
MNESLPIHQTHQEQEHGKPESHDLKVIYWGENNTNDERTFVAGSSTTESSHQQQQSQQQPGMDKWGPLPFSGFAAQNQSDAVFGSSIQNYMESIRSWSSGGSFGNASPPPATTTPVIAPPLPLLPMAQEENDHPPGMIRSTSGSLSSETSSEGDETMSSGGCSDDDEMGGSSAADQPAAKGVTFNEHVRVLPIPPVSAYTPNQRFRMYANRFELRENKVRNKREYEFDNYDWRNATEEHSMAICPLSGELLHPAHL